MSIVSWFSTDTKSVQWRTRGPVHKIVQPCPPACCTRSCACLATLPAHWPPALLGLEPCSYRGGPKRSSMHLMVTDCLVVSVVMPLGLLLLWWCGNHCLSRYKNKWTSDTYLVSYTKINLKWIVDLHVKLKLQNKGKDNIGEKSLQSWVVQKFLNITPNALSLKRKKWTNWAFSKLRSFARWKTMWRQ